jgi:hypothetical protein
MLIFSFVLIVITVGFVIAQVWSKLSNVANKNQAIVSGLLGLGIAGLAVGTALPFNDRIEYKIGNRIESQPAWLVPPKAELEA